MGYVQPMFDTFYRVVVVVEAPSSWGMCNIEKLTFWCKENFCNKKKRRAENVSSRLVFAFIKSYYLDFSVADFVRDPVRFLTASQYPGRTKRPTGAGIYVSRGSADRERRLAAGLRPRPGKVFDCVAVPGQDDATNGSGYIRLARQRGQGTAPRRRTLSAIQKGF